MFDLMNQNDAVQLDSFDNQFSTGEWDYLNQGSNEQPVLPGNSFDSSFMSKGDEYIFQHHDPLIHANEFQMKPLNLHFVKPHYVEGYVRTDGTVVDGYFRDGHGQGYLRTNPDGKIENNLSFIENK